MDNKTINNAQELGQEQNVKAYPPLKTVLPAMAAIYLAVFLVALVRTS